MGWLLRLLFPPKCALCRKVLTGQQTDLCHTCREEAETWQMGKRNIQFLDSITAVWYYEGYVRSSILRYKFYGARYLAKSYGRLLAMELTRDDGVEFDVLTWVPVSRRRKLARGYDQVQLLAMSVGKELGIRPVRVLKKIRNNKKQSSLQGYAQRKGNVMGAYRCIRPEQIRGKRVLLLDDVLTTGATARECAKEIRICGAKEVHCAVIAAARK